MKGKRAECEIWLWEYLADGEPKGSVELYAAAALSGFSSRSIARARRKMGLYVKARKFGVGTEAHWCWQLVVKLKRLPQIAAQGDAGEPNLDDVEI